MPKFLVETVSMYRMRYVIDTENEDWAKDEVTMDHNGKLKEFSQLHLGDTISSVREITEDEYINLFDKDNAYLSEWPVDQKFKFINKIEEDSDAVGS